MKLVIGLVILGMILMSCRTARAEPPAWTSKAVVEVVAYEHSSLGVAVEGGWRVLVPYVTIEVDHPGSIDVIDANGKTKAWVVATDKAEGLALLAVERPIAAALVPSPNHLGANGLFAIETTAEMGNMTWSAYPPPPAPPPSPPTPPGKPPPPSHHVASGSPIIDGEGRLVGLDRSTSGGLTSPKAPGIAGPSLARMTAPAPPRARRQFIFYGSGAMQFEFASKGGVWWGMNMSIAVRWRDSIELRTDGSATFLLPSNRTHECGEPPCFAGTRGVLTPSIGPHFSLGTGAPIGITPAVGLAMGAQKAYSDGGPPSDVRAPNTWMMPAFGVSVTFALGELHARARLPHGAMENPSYEIGVGLTF